MLEEQMSLKRLAALAPAIRFPTDAAQVGLARSDFEAESAESTQGLLGRAESTQGLLGRAESTQGLLGRRSAHADGDLPSRSLCLEPLEAARHLVEGDDPIDERAQQAAGEEVAQRREVPGARANDDEACPRVAEGRRRDVEEQWRARNGGDVDPALIEAALDRSEPPVADDIEDDAVSLAPIEDGVELIVERSIGAQLPA